jgi:hypothetical protein
MMAARSNRPSREQEDGAWIALPRAGLRSRAVWRSIGILTSHENEVQNKMPGSTACQIIDRQFAR